MIVIAGTFRLPEASRDKARVTMQRMIDASRAEDGCLDYSYAFDVNEPGLVRVFERWRDATAFHRHAASPHLQEWRSSWAALGIAEHSLRAYQTDAGEPV